MRLYLLILIAFFIVGGSALAINYSSLNNAFSFKNVLQIEGASISIGQPSITDIEGLAVARNIILRSAAALRLIDNSVIINQNGIQTSQIQTTNGATLQVQNQNIPVNIIDTSSGDDSDVKIDDRVSASQVVVGAQDEYERNALQVETINSSEVSGAGGSLALGVTNDTVIFDLTTSTHFDGLYGSGQELCVFRDIELSISDQGKFVVERPTTCGEGRYLLDIDMSNRKAICCLACALPGVNTTGEQECAQQVINSIPAQ